MNSRHGSIVFYQLGCQTSIVRFPFNIRTIAANSIGDHERAGRGSPHECAVNDGGGGLRFVLSKVAPSSCEGGDTEVS